MAFTKAQKEFLTYIRSLDRDEAKEKMDKIIKLTPEGAHIQGKELTKIYNKLGYDGAIETAKINYDFADELAKLTREIHQS